MSRRLLGPVGGPILFFLVAALVFAGLGWVTYSALGVEQAQREAAARAELGNNLRVALWRLDGRMLPALGVEDSRPFYHYAPSDPAATPLLAANLPDWMKLHFQLDPAAGWHSPQVIDDPEIAELVRQAWSEGGPLRNFNGPRTEFLKSDLQPKFPPRATCELFALRDSAIPADSLPLAAPYLTNTNDANPPAQPSAGPQVPANPPTQAVSPPAGAGGSQSGGGPDPADTVRVLGFELCLRNATEPSYAQQALNNYQQLQGQGGQVPQQRLLNPQGNQMVNRGGSRSQIENERGWFDYATRAGTIGKAMQEAKQAADDRIGRGVPTTQNNLQYPNSDQKNNPGNVGPNSPNPRMDGNPTVPPGPPLPQPPNPAPPGPPTTGPIGAPIEPRPMVGSGGYSGGPTALDKLSQEKAAKELALRHLATPPNALGVLLAETVKAAERDKLKANEHRSREVPGTATVPPVTTPPVVNPTPFQPLAIHLGSMRPQWLTAPDGTEMLVLVRIAHADNKTFYQGVILDWQKLQATLQEEVKDLFPTATLVPVKDPEGVSPERAMTALPVQLDVGPEPILAPAGWTPLRLGLLLAWVAAVIAFVAVGISGWSLIDLAERRIRFVSAVTHELRTPLTSLRLYLDLLVSGMIQDEAKKQEYLNTLAMESDRLHRLIDNVLDFAKLEKRHKNGDMKPVKVGEVIEQLRQTWTDRVALDGMELVVISTLPAEREVCTDAAMLHQIVGNLIDNARKYARDAADKRIWLWAKPGADNTIHIEVEDRGAGVPMSERRTIFKPFRRGDHADAKAGGAGLGLALAKSWAEVLGGTLCYRPADGGMGACFRLELKGV